ncbi:MAG: fatty acid desaturase [Byssovorax sp.]
MTTLAPLAPPTASAPRTKGTSGLVTVSSTLFGLVFALSFYIYRKVTLAIFAAAAGVFKALRLAPVIRRAPTTFALLSVAGAIAAAPFGDLVFALQRPSRAALLGLAAYWLSSGVFMLASEVLCTPPGELTRLREVLDRRFPERWFLRWLDHPVDAYFVRVTIHSTILVVPALLAFALRPSPSPLTALFCLLGQRVIARVHEAMDHGNIHNQVFRPRADAPPVAAAICRAVGFYQEYPLNLAVGRIPGMYPIQHVAVHHAEDGSLDDNQTTVLRDRTSFLQYCATCTTWLLSRLFALDVAYYLLVRRRTKLLRSLLLHVAGYYLFLGLVALVSPHAVLLIFISHALPTPDTVITQYNWHGFVDIADFHNTYRNTIHVASTVELGFLGLNAHLHHHLHASCHWSEIANEARREEDRYRREGAAILRGSNRDRMLLVKLLFARDFKALAGEFASIGDAPREDFARILEERTLPLVPRRWPAALVSFDRALGRAFARVLL